MKRKKALTPLGETEMEVLHDIWAAGEATVAQVHERLSASRKLAYTTIMTVMRNLATKGYLTARREGVRDHYKAARSPEAVRGSLLRDIIGSAFDDSPLSLVQTLVRSEKISDEERAEIRRLLEEL